MKPININNIIIDKGTQSRAGINDEVVADYAYAMQQGDQFPPVIVYFDGVDYYLADGFHRLHAIKRLGKASVQADVRTGTLRDAILYSLGANRDHGLRRTNEDKRKCVRTLLEDFEWGEMSIAEMANKCGVSPQLVAAVKHEMETGSRLSTVKTNAPKKPKPVKLNNVVEVETLNLAAEKDEAVAALVSENQRLSDRLAVEAMDATPEEKLAATETLDDLREQIRILEIENQSLKISRDTFQRENAEMKKTISSLQRKLKKEE
jgi:ParB-like chromosome segregation protein Spo0J